MNHPMYRPCIEWKEKLAATHPDDLSPFERAALETHVALCLACAAVRAEYHAIDALMLGSADIEPLPDLLAWQLQPRKEPARLNDSYAPVPISSLAVLTAGEIAAEQVDSEVPSPVPAMSELLGAMSLSALADRCMSEINNYLRGEPSNDQYGLEIFRRAMLEHDDAAWTVLENRFREFMLGSFRRHPRCEAASRLDSPENYVARAFTRFWIAAVHNQQLEFTTLAAALRYLRGCLNSTILDPLRAYSRAKEVALLEPDFGWELAGEDSDDGPDLWEAIRSILPSEHEQRLAYLLYHCNLKPREILRVCPQEFSNVQEIYRLRRNIVERAQRDVDYIRWKLNGEKA